MQIDRKEAWLRDRPELWQLLQKVRKSSVEERVMSSPSSPNPAKETAKKIEGMIEIGTKDAKEAFSEVLEEIRQKVNANINNSFPEGQVISYKEDLKDVKNIEELIVKLSKKHGVDPALVKAMVKVESNFDPKAVSPVGAKGLMQIMPGTAKDLGIKDPLDPKQNLEGGIKYMKRLLKKYNNDVTLALAAYNAGPGNVDKHDGIPPFSETKNYVRKVLHAYTVYAQETF